MKKIMFNDECGLTQAVLEGRKTMTRRIIKCPRTFRGEWVAGFNVHIRQSDKKIADYPCMYDADGREFDEGEILPMYKIGEVVAIAQSYKSIVERLAKKGYDVATWMDDNHITKNMAGWLNKMFVRAGLMIFKIRITNIKIERLQDISDDECLREGVNMLKANEIGKALGFDKKYEIPGFFPVFDTPREAFADLIDKVSGKGIWNSNPYVFVYEFELVD